MGIAGVIFTLCVDLLKEVVDQKRDITLALPKWRQLKHCDCKPIIEIRSEAMLGNLMEQIAIGGSNDANIHRNGTRFTNPGNFLLLEYSEDFYLCLEGKLTDFIQEQRTAISCLEIPLSIFNCTGKCPLLVAEEFRLD